MAVALRVTLKYNDTMLCDSLNHDLFTDFKISFLLRS
jgi:hypothetical protein